MVGEEVLWELYTRPGAPNPENTELVMSVTAKLPHITGFVFRRMLGLYDARLFDPKTSADIGLGAQPTIDWLNGVNFDWSTFRLLKDYTPNRGIDYEDSLRELNKSVAIQWSQGPGKHLPAWIAPDLMLVEWCCCEKRKDSQETCRCSSKKYERREDYSELVGKFEDVYVKHGVVCSVVGHRDGDAHELLQSAVARLHLKRQGPCSVPGYCAADATGATVSADLPAKRRIARKRRAERSGGVAKKTSAQRF